MPKLEVAVGAFRQRAARFVRQVEETREPITITRPGVPVAELCAVAGGPEALFGSVTCIDPGLTGPAVEARDWEAGW